MRVFGKNSWVATHEKIAESAGFWKKIMSEKMSKTTDFWGNTMGRPSPSCVIFPDPCRVGAFGRQACVPVTTKNALFGSKARCDCTYDTDLYISHYKPRFGWQLLMAAFHFAGFSMVGRS